MGVCYKHIIFSTYECEVVFAPWLINVELAFLMMLCLVIVIGNSMTFTVIMKTKRLRTTTNNFVLCLAASDLLVGTIIAIAIILHISEIDQRINQQSWSITWSVMIMFSMEFSINSVFLIACERFLYIVHPLRYHGLMHSYRTYACVCLLYIWTFFSSVASIWSNNCRETLCYYYSGSTKELVILQVVPLALQYIGMIFCYGAIVKVALEQRRKIQIANYNNQCLNHSGLKLAKMMFYVMGIFTVCVLPHMILYVTDVIANTRYLVSVGLYTGSAAILNTGMNFFIYLTNDSQFRKAIKQLFSCRKSS